jgi:uncharacterized protein
MAHEHKGFLPLQCTIDGYAQGGFHFADMSHKGSLLVLPSGVYAWEPTETASITPDNLALLFALPQGDVDLLIVGTGRTLNILPSATRAALAEHGIRHEPMATALAISTYNIVFGEGRRVAAALLAVPL